MKASKVVRFPEKTPELGEFLNRIYSGPHASRFLFKVYDELLEDFVSVPMERSECVPGKHGWETVTRLARERKVVSVELDGATLVIEIR